MLEKPSSKIVINLPLTYEKLHCKASDLRNTSLQTDNDKKIDILLLLCSECLLAIDVEYRCITFTTVRKIENSVFKNDTHLHCLSLG